MPRLLVRAFSEAQNELSAAEYAKAVASLVEQLKDKAAWPAEGEVLRVEHGVVVFEVVRQLAAAAGPNDGEVPV